MNWDVEKAVWWRAFKSLLQMQPQDCGLLMTEPPFNLPSIQASTLQVLLNSACIDLTILICIGLKVSGTLPALACVRQQQSYACS